jgi:uncharacterized protein
VSYKAPLFLFNGHLETIYPSLIRRVGIKPYERERIATPDNDFLDLDWLKQGSRRLLIISHGLEGNSERAYVKGLARASYAQGFDVLAWNFRGCSGEINRQLRFYHSGATEDLECVVQHVLRKSEYNEISLAGFSLGGNLTLKYLGERVPDESIKKSVVFSVPLDLHSSCLKISMPSNWVYSNRFLKSLKLKILMKRQLYPELDIRDIHRIKTLKAFDDAYTAPLHGFKDAVDYYTRNSSLHFVKNITTPTLIINARNDPFLTDACFPVDDVRNHPMVSLEVTRRGGHVGFSRFTAAGLYWSEERALHFLQSE